MLLQMSDISKGFFGIPVLHGIDLHLDAGQTLVLAGENGAGKSTLMKILGGVHSPDSGSILIDGQPVILRQPLDAERAGIAIIHQELSVIGAMSVQDNLFLGHEITRLGMVNRRDQGRRAQELLRPFGLGDIDTSRRLETFPIAVRQLIEIARATSRDARVIVMDEPTSSLADPDVAKLVQIMADMKSRGAGIIFISHKMSEIYQVADQIMVMRDGRHVATSAAAEMSPQALITNLVGRELTGQIPAPPPLEADAPEMMKVSGLSVASPTLPGQWVIQDVGFSVRRGEILGFSGLQGSGCSDVFHALYGSFGRRARGTILSETIRSLPRSPREAIAHRIAFLPADRKESGLILQMSVAQNITLPTLPKFSPGGWLSNGDENRCAGGYIEALRIRCMGPRQPVRFLSGGNQQKVLLARCLETKPILLLLDEPTRGVDVGAKHEIYELISQIRKQGTTILLITTELPEMLGLADRICVMHRGHISNVLSRDEATQENILAAAMGGEAQSA